MTLSKSNRNKCLFAVLLLGCTIFFSSWSMPMTPGVFNRFFNMSDTVPPKCDTKIAELNEAIAHVQKATESLRERDIKSEVAEAMEGINFEEIHSNVSEAIVQAKSALTKVDAKKIKEEVALALEKIDKEKIEEQVRLATANLQPQILKSLDDAKRELERAKRELESAKQKLRKDKI